MNSKKTRRKNGEGTFRKSNNGKGTIMKKQVGTKDNGKPKIITVTGTSVTDCIKKMNERIANMNPLDVNPSSIQIDTLTKLCELHLQEDISAQNIVKDKAIDRRESTINNQIKPYAIGSLKINTITSKDVNDHIDTLVKAGLSVSTVEKAYNVINAAFNWAKLQGVIRNNPCDTISKKTKKRFENLETKNSADGVVIVLSDEQIFKLNEYVNHKIDECDTHKKLFALSVVLLLKTGMREGELCALRWSDYDNELGTISISKTRYVAKDRVNGGYKPAEDVVKNYHCRTIELSDDAIEILNKMYQVTDKKAKDDYIFLNRSKKPSNPSNYCSRINKFYSDIGFSADISGAHILRRTCATKMHNDGCTVEDIAAYLGDTPETVIKHYISLTKQIVADGKVLNVVKLPKSTAR